MWPILRGIANFIAALMLFAIGMYALLWGFFFLLESVQGHSYGGYSAIQLYVAGLLCLCALFVTLVFAAFLAARGWHLVRRRWPTVANVIFDPLVIKAMIRRGWIASTAIALTVVPAYFAVWGWPNWSNLPFMVVFFASLFIVLWIPTVIVHELTYAVGMWIVGQVPSNQIRFGVHVRQGIIYAHTHHDMTVWASQVALLLPVLMLGVIPAYAGLVFQQPLVMTYGLVILRASSVNLTMAWRTLAFPATASFNECIESDEMLKAAVRAEPPGAQLMG